MRITIVFFVLLMFVGIFYERGHADNETVIRWNSRTQLILAQCMLAEADESKDDHIAIAYAVRNWLKLVRRRYPMTRYTDLLRRYCSVHKLGFDRLSRRQRWIRQMSFPIKGEGGEIHLNKPKTFPRTASWERKSQKWIEILQRAHEWRVGKYQDPCRGRAIMWGAPQDKDNRWYLPSDKPRGRLVRVKCVGELENWYYRMGSKS